MRTAILSDIHGNLTAFEAVLADLRRQSPDLILHGGDLADAGSSPAEIMDQIRALGWQGVLGNTDQMLIHPQSLGDFATQSSAPPAIWDAIRQIADATRETLGPDRLAWLATLPLTLLEPTFALVHAAPDDPWRTPTDPAAYAPLARPLIITAHTHIPSIGPRVINTGSVGLPYDGDPRACYLLLDDTTPTIRRVPYDLERELTLLAATNLPGAAWTARMLRTATPQLP